MFTRRGYDWSDRFRNIIASVWDGKTMDANMPRATPCGVAVCRMMPFECVREPEARAYEILP
jgi:hypothetical protein